jgi:hypothetical protein
MICGSMVCDSCGTVTSYAILQGRKRFCEECYIRMKPPTLILTKHWTSNVLFDPEKKLYIGKGLKFFEGCGFKVFNHRVFSNNMASPLFREHITLRYYGSLSCSMIPEFRWPKSRQYCRHFNCYFGQ